MVYNVVLKNSWRANMLCVAIVSLNPRWCWGTVEDRTAQAFEHPDTFGSLRPVDVNACSWFDLDMTEQRREQKPVAIVVVKW